MSSLQLLRSIPGSSFKSQVLWWGLLVVGIVILFFRPDPMVAVSRTMANFSLGMSTADCISIHGAPAVKYSEGEIVEPKGYYPAIDRRVDHQAWLYDYQYYAVVVFFDANEKASYIYLGFT